jgi:hypothetical protein
LKIIVFFRYADGQESGWGRLQVLTLLESVGPLTKLFHVVAQASWPRTLLRGPEQDIRPQCAQGAESGFTSAGRQDDGQ